jgi:hypothetical protein
MLPGTRPASANPPGPSITVAYVQSPGDGNLAGPHWDSTITITDADGIKNATYSTTGLGTPDPTTNNLGVPGSCPNPFTITIHNTDRVVQVAAQDCESTPHVGYYRLFTASLGVLIFTVPKPAAAVVAASGTNVRDKNGGGAVGTGTFHGEASGGGTKFTGAVDKTNNNGPYIVQVSVDPPGDLYNYTFLLADGAPFLATPGVIVLSALLMGTAGLVITRRRKLAAGGLSG